jgi:hypothetical protein
MLDGLKAGDQAQASGLAKFGAEDAVMNERPDSLFSAVNRRSRWLYAADAREASLLELLEKGSVAGSDIERPAAARESIYHLVNQTPVGVAGKVRLFLAIVGGLFVRLG